LPYWTMYTKGMTRGKVLEYWAHPYEWIEQMIADEQKREEEPKIVQWAKKNNIISNWELPYKDDRIAMAYALYKIGRIIAPKDKQYVFDIIEINEELDKKII